MNNLNRLYFQQCLRRVPRQLSRQLLRQLPRQLLRQSPRQLLRQSLRQVPMKRKRSRLSWFLKNQILTNHGQ